MFWHNLPYFLGSFISGDPVLRHISWSDWQLSAWPLPVALDSTWQGEGSVTVIPPALSFPAILTLIIFTIHFLEEWFFFFIYCRCDPISSYLSLAKNPPMASSMQWLQLQWLLAIRGKSESLTLAYKAVYALAMPCISHPGWLISSLLNMSNLFLLWGMVITPTMSGMLLLCESLWSFKSWLKCLSSKGGLSWSS